MAFRIEDKVLSSGCFYYSVMQISFYKNYLERFSFSIRANSAALSSFP
jgi:hypothetical protein